MGRVMTTQMPRAMGKTRGISEGMSKGEVSQEGRPSNLQRISRIGQVTSQASAGLAEGQESSEFSVGPHWLVSFREVGLT